jgi:hypothetical protein
LAHGFVFPRMTKPRTILSIAAATLTASSLAMASPLAPVRPIRLPDVKVLKPIVDAAGRPGCGNTMTKKKNPCAHVGGR